MLDDLWLAAPEDAYAQWQREEATGADRRAFADQSIVQHRSMFSRFNDYLIAHRVNVANYGADHLDGFFTNLAQDCAPGTTTRLRYLKLIDRFTRHLVNIELRADDPAAQMLVNESWPEDEPRPIYLSSEEDARLQAVCVSTEGAAFKELRNTAIVALFLASGVTAAELRQLRVDDLDVDNDRPTVFVDKHGPRTARRVPIEAFAIDILCDYHHARRSIQCTMQWLFVTTASGKPMQPDTLLKCVRAAMGGAGLTAADESPRLLRNTFGRRQIIACKTNGQVSNLMGLSSHRTATRLRQTVDANEMSDAQA
ncbi:MULTISPECIES: tyrosine-type recombinase/integrase [unclassified Caballeronia]|uniref:tyrosine-type recombinase/integrase n=1 Tax=unclassified Caballeronia TaxID=2646786 RepID=UPI002854ED7C|nr:MULTISPECIES: tyrosine-type recombinase/integrase [unclassified Caballeronia]MDR5755202.1 tyrosine-type recombinase/integrase [Caballeronia sp. LZ024]MDR5845388.1 tyrosine-type recombinase/integrase [Caballeronia sp. LZ031]